MDTPRLRTYRLLRFLERYTKTDMVYLTRGGSWLFLGQAGAIILSFSLAVAFGHLASQDTYGNYKFILSVAGVLGALSLSGVGTAIAQAVARGREGALPQGFRLNLLSGAGIVLLGLMGAAYYAYEGNLFVAASLVAVALLTPLSNSFSLYDAYLVGTRDFKRQTLYGLTTYAVTTVLLIGVLYVNPRAILLVAAYLFASTGAMAFWYWRTVRRTRNKAREPELLRYGGHLSVMNVIGMVADKVDSIIVFTVLGPAQVGVYAYAIALPEQIKMAVKSIVPLALPKFAERTLAEVRQTIWIRMLYLMAGLAIVLGAYALAAPFLFQTFFPVYLESVPFSRIYALSLVAVGIITPLTALFQAQRMTRELYWSSNVGAIILLVSLPILVPLWGILGAIVAQIIYRVSTALLMTYQFVRASRQRAL